MMREFLEKQWNLIGGATAWVAGILANFWREPNLIASQKFGNLSDFGHFFLMLLMALFLIPVHLYRRREHLRKWVFFAVVFAILAPAAFFSYSALERSWTCSYANAMVIVGGPGDLTEPHGRQYVERNPGITDEQLVYQHAGEVAEIWHEEVIDRRRMILAILHVLFPPFFAAALICSVQAFYCGTQAR